MRLGRELREPWAIVLGGLAAGLGWAIGIPAIAAAGVGAAVYGVRVVAGVVVDRFQGVEGMPEIRPGTRQAEWLQRAQRAVQALERSRATAPTPVADRVAKMASNAASTLDDIRRLAGHSARVDAALGQVDRAGLVVEADRLHAELSRAPGDDLREDIQRSLDSIRAQTEVGTRLDEAAIKLQARIQAVILGLESLVARLREVLAIMPTESPGTGEASVDALAVELEGWRADLAETEEVSRRALVAYVGQTGSGAPAGTSRGLPSRTRPGLESYDAAELRGSLDGLLRSIRGHVPADIYEKVASIRDSILLTIPENPAEASVAADPNVYLIRQTALDYLPAALQSYLSLPPQYAERPITADGQTPHGALLSQLDLMDRKMREVADDVVRHDSDRLLANGRFLRERFGTSALDIGGAGDVRTEQRAPDKS